MKKRIIKIIGAALAAALCFTVLFAELTADINMRYVPDYEKADIIGCFFIRRDSGKERLTN